jgi:hypothetical protein|tara:strand:+ start:293 stop:502 length:210 start_codon:yes stop_codon:yes gene_type:complete
MTEQNLRTMFTGKSYRSEDDLKRLIKDAQWQVDYYTKDVQKAQDNLYIRQLALECLENELNIVTDVSQL